MLVVERKRLRLQTAALQRELQGLYGFDQLVGRRRTLQQANALLEQAWSLDSAVLLSGASGTGKELAARASSRNLTPRSSPVAATSGSEPAITCVAACPPRGRRAGVTLREAC